MIDDAKMIQKRYRIDARFFYNISGKKAQGEETTDDMKQ